MIKLFGGLLFIVIFAAIAISAIGAYLGPDGLSRCDPYPSTKDDCQAVDAIVAISGGDTSARTAQAIDLYKHQWAQLLVFSGAAQDTSGPSNAEAMKRQAIAAGVPEADVLLDETSQTTKQNASNAIALFTQHDIRSVILVTSAYHQRRAGLEFGQRAGSAIKIINHPVRTDDQWSPWWWLTPTGWWLAISELFKILVFYMGVSR
ncbi:MAG: exported protein of unknown function [Candidatus Saccharibacteria bacterium]|nr:exported protein of unknown function [Candidatus Saccharibacteria bacterium]